METKIEIGSWRDNEMNIKDFKWTREPDDYTLTDDKIEIITQLGTDLWQRRQREGCSSGRCNYYDA